MTRIIGDGGVTGFQMRKVDVESAEAEEKEHSSTAFSWSVEDPRLIRTTAAAPRHSRSEMSSTHPTVSRKSTTLWKYPKVEAIVGAMFESEVPWERAISEQDASMTRFIAHQF